MVPFIAFLRKIYIIFSTQLLGKEILQWLGASWRPHKAHCLGLLFETRAYTEAERKHKVGQGCRVFMADTEMVEITRVTER